MEAAWEGYFDLVQMPIDRGADINKKITVNTALMFASLNAHAQIVHYLMHLGADFEEEGFKNYLQWFPKEIMEHSCRLV